MKRSEGPNPALASNWRTVLLVDAVLGLLALSIGLVLTQAGRVAVGALLSAAAIVYWGLIARRARRWKRLRREAGLE